METKQKIVGKKISQLNTVSSSSLDGSEYLIIEKNGSTGNITLNDLNSVIGVNTSSLDEKYIFKNVEETYPSTGEVDGEEVLPIQKQGQNEKIEMSRFLYRTNTDSHYDAQTDLNMAGRWINNLNPGSFEGDATNVGQLVDFEFTTLAAKVSLYINGDGNVFIASDQKYILTLPDNTRQIIDDGNQQEIAVTEGVLVIDFPLNKPNVLSINSGLISHWLSAYGLENLSELSLNDTVMTEFFFSKQNEGYTRDSRKYGFANDMDGPINMSNNQNLTMLNINHNQASSVDISNCPNVQFLSIANNNYGSSSIDLQFMTSLIELDAGSINVASAYLPSTIQRVNLYGNQIESSSFSINQNLEYMNLHDNGVTSLEISGTSLTAIALASNPNISYLDLSNNNLDDLWVAESAFVGGGTMYLNNNNLDADQLNRVFNDLLEGDASIDITNNPGADDCDIQIAENKGYTIIR